MDTNGVYGYNDSDVRFIYDEIIGRCTNVHDYLTFDMQEKFVNVMAENWFCKEAQDFFANFKQKNDQLVKTVDNKFREIYEIIHDAEMMWAQQTQGKVSRSWGMAGGATNLDISGIKENYNNIRGINMKKVPEIMNTFTTTIEKVKEDMQYIKDSTQRVPFLGGNQQEKLVYLIDSTTKIIVEKVTEFISGTKTAIDSTLAKYGGTAAMVSERLSGN